MATLQITAYTPAKAAFGDKPISAAELKRMPEPYKFGPAVDKYRRLPKTAPPCARSTARRSTRC